MIASDRAPVLAEASPVLELARAIADRGGRVLVVGGWLRDQILGRPSRDLDLEVFGSTPENLQKILEPFGAKRAVGRQFPVWKLVRGDLDVALPRGVSPRIDAGDPRQLAEAFREAARHRDLTINALGWDPLEGRWLDPWQGRRDLERRALRAVDAETFGEDPLRVLRVARLHASLEATVDEPLAGLCREIDLEGLAVERIGLELGRMLLEPARPSRAFAFLERVGQLGVFEPVDALRGVPQDPRWHPEGDVFEHTLLCLDRAAELRRGLPSQEAEVLMLATLCHDLGKPGTTRAEGDRIRALGHEALGARIAEEWLSALRWPRRRVVSVRTLVARHLAPSQLVAQQSGPRAYRRLARRLEAGGVNAIELERVARADHLGRTTEDARCGRFEAGDLFLAAAEAAAVREGARPPIVQAHHLLARGLAPGPALGRALERCTRLQDERGWTDPERIADAVAGPKTRAGGTDRGRRVEAEPTD